MRSYLEVFFMGRRGVRQGRENSDPRRRIELQMIARALAIGCVGWVLTLGGCRSAAPTRSAAPIEPSGGSFTHTDAPSPAEDSEHAANAGPVRRVYSQVTAGKSKAKSVEFVQVDGAEGRLAGTLLDRAKLPVSQYMDRHSQRPTRPQLNWPHGRRAEAFFIEFDPPMEEWPQVVREDRPTDQHAGLIAFGSDGLPFTHGKARRRVWHDGVETIRTPAGKFADCTRLRAETDLRFGRWASLRVQETAWVSPDAGVVRRTERITGHAIFIFRFDSTHRYELTSHDPTASARLVRHSPSDSASPVDKGESGGGVSEEVSARNSAPKRWSRLAIHIERAGARPRVAGLAVDWQ